MLRCCSEQEERRNILGSRAHCPRFGIDQRHAAGLHTTGPRALSVFGNWLSTPQSKSEHQTHRGTKGRLAAPSSSQHGTRLLTANAAQAPLHQLEIIDRAIYRALTEECSLHPWSGESSSFMYHVTDTYFFCFTSRAKEGQRRQWEGGPRRVPARVDTNSQTRWLAASRPTCGWQSGVAQ